MDLNIGTNIKRMRLAKGLTQEQLADLLGISTAAVSKWEAKNTYPDITMLFPLAEIFDVSVDMLLGYDEAKAKNEVEKIIAEYHELSKNGYFAEAGAILADARKKYPHNYTIMHTYMWDKAGGSAGNSAEILLENQVEFTQICNCILDGCSDETIRLEALNMKAKLLHAQADMNGALAILAQFPNWWGSSGQKTEQLFAKDTLEYRYWNKKNCYELMEIMASKLARSVWFDETISLSEKVLKIESTGDEFAKISQYKGLECFCVVSLVIYAELAGKLSADGSVQDVIRVREKQFAVMEHMMKISKTDAVLKECMETIFKTEDILGWQVDYLLKSQHGKFVKLHEYPEYVEMLSKWKKNSFFE